MVNTPLIAHFAIKGHTAYMDSFVASPKKGLSKRDSAGIPVPTYERPPAMSRQPADPGATRDHQTSPGNISSVRSSATSRQAVH